MGKSVEVNHVSLGGEVGTNDWAMPYLDAQHEQYALQTLQDAAALVLGSKTYEGLSAVYTQMRSNPFVDLMNALPKYVATRSLHDLEWNATPFEGDVADFVRDLKESTDGAIVKYGNGPLDDPLMAETLIDEFHLLLAPVAAGTGWHLFEAIEGAPTMNLLRVDRFDSGLVLLVYEPMRP